MILILVPEFPEKDFDSAGFLTQVVPINYGQRAGSHSFKKKAPTIGYDMGVSF